MRDKIRWWLIQIANWIGTKNYYDLGSPIQGMVNHKKDLIVFTKQSIYKYVDGKYKRIRPTK